MVDRRIVQLRLLSQGLIGPRAADAHAVVSHLGAMQGQDLPGVMGSIALRLGSDSTRSPDRGISAVIRAFDEGSVVRGYPMRGTVFAVAAEDLAWMTALCADPPLRAQVGRRAQLGLDDVRVERMRDLVLTALATAPRGMSRQDVFALWESEGLPATKGRGYHVLSHLVMRGDLAYGPWGGKDNAVVDARRWLPSGSGLEERFGGDRVAATGELLVRYLSSHGPATLRDFAWWTKLPLGLIREAFPQVKDQVEALEGLEDSAGETRYARPGLLGDRVEHGADADALFLLPGFDEMVLGYPDRTVAVREEHHDRLVPGNNGVFQKAVLRRGEIIGLWKRSGRAGKRTLEVDPFGRMPKVARDQAERAHRTFPHVGD